MAFRLGLVLVFEIGLCVLYLVLGWNTMGKTQAGWPGLDCVGVILLWRIGIICSHDNRVGTDFSMACSQIVFMFCHRSLVEDI